MLKTPIGRLRAIAMIEGVSFLLLLFIAMPMKYLGGIDMAVKIVGWAHGLLFLLFCLALLLAMPALRYNLGRCAMVFIAALLPFGPFVIDGKLRHDDEAIGDA